MSPRIYCCAHFPEGNPDNEELYTDVDRFHMQKDKIKFGGGTGDSSDSDNSVRFMFYLFFLSVFTRCVSSKHPDLVDFTRTSS